MSEALRQVVWKCDRCGGDAQAIFGIFPSCKCGSTSFKAAQPPAPTAQQCTCPSGDGSLRWPCPQHPANIAQPVQQPGAEPVGYMSPQQTELVKDLDGEAGYYIPIRKTPAGLFTLALYTQAAPAQRQPLSDDTKTQMWRAAYRDDPRRLGSFEWYAQGVEDAEAAHGITAAPAAQKGEKL